MSRRAVLAVAAAVVALYLCIIVLVLAPLQDAGAAGRAHAVPSWCHGLRWHAPVDPAVPPVALASFPGSGNTWLRYLLQQATGVVTGSIYLDYSLRSHGFPGENVSTASVLVVKTHEPCAVAEGPPRYRAAVLLVRHPGDAILADFNRLHRGHVGTAPRSAFIPNPHTSTGKRKLDWSEHVAKTIHSWRHFHTSWLRIFRGPLHVVQYERLVVDTRNTLGALLRFLNQTVSSEAMDCAMMNKEGIYRRRKQLGFEPYTPELRNSLGRAWGELLAELVRYRDGGVYANSGLPLV